MLKELLVAGGVVAVCVVIHTSGMIFLAEQLLARRAWLERRASAALNTLCLIAIFSVIILLHLIETAIWAACYQAWQLFPDYETSFYFSLGSYTTIGYGDVVLPRRWRLLGGIEGVSGVLLCGLSTAFIFVVVTTLMRIRGRQVA